MIPSSKCSKHFIETYADYHRSMYDIAQRDTNNTNSRINTIMERIDIEHMVDRGERGEGADIHLPDLCNISSTRTRRPGVTKMINNWIPKSIKEHEEQDVEDGGDGGDGAEDVKVVVVGDDQCTSVNHHNLHSIWEPGCNQHLTSRLSADKLRYLASRRISKNSLTGLKDRCSKLRKQRIPKVVEECCGTMQNLDEEDDNKMKEEEEEDGELKGMQERTKLLIHRSRRLCTALYEKPTAGRKIGQPTEPSTTQLFSMSNNNNGSEYEVLTLDHTKRWREKSVNRTQAALLARKKRFNSTGHASRSNSAWFNKANRSNSVSACSNYSSMTAST